MACCIQMSAGRIFLLDTLQQAATRAGRVRCWICIKKQAGTPVRWICCTEQAANASAGRAATARIWHGQCRERLCRERASRSKLSRMPNAAMPAQEAGSRAMTHVHAQMRQQSAQCRLQERRLIIRLGQQRPCRRYVSAQGLRVDTRLRQQGSCKPHVRGECDADRFSGFNARSRWRVFAQVA